MNKDQSSYNSLSMLGVLLSVLTIFVSINNVFPQTHGCTDPLANNYNAEATINDGSCSYNLTIHNPQFRFMLPSIVDETSGLAFYKGRYYTINDSGGEAVVYGIDSITGEVDQHINVQANNVDWESLAMDEEFMYIGDFGNNSGIRDDLVIYRINLSDIPEYGNATVEAFEISFVYSDYSTDNINNRDHNYDCEAFLATDNWLFLFSKNRGDYQSKLYRLPKSPGNYNAELISTFNVNGLITGADINDRSNEITLVGYTDQSWIPFIWLLWDYGDGNFFSGNKRRIDMPNMVATQTEAITYINGKNELITSEGNPLFTQSAYNFSSAKWTNGNVSSVNDQVAERFNFTINPNPVKKNKINVDITNLRNGDYQLEVYEISGQRIENISYKIKRKSDRTRVKIKLDGLGSGIYFIRISSGTQTIEKKFIIQ